MLKLAASFSMVGVLTILNTKAGPQMMAFDAVHTAAIFEEITAMVCDGLRCLKL